LILTGPGWKYVMDTLFESFVAYIPHNQRNLLRFALDFREAVRLLTIYQ
jgi:hypothetical protein